MRILSFLVVTFVLCSTCSGFTVVMKSGKRVQGTVIGEDQTTLQLRDSSGILLSFKKTTIDQQATSAVNSTNRDATSLMPQQPGSRSVIRTYTKEDLSRMPDLSIVEGDSEPVESFESDSAASTDSFEPGIKEERYWRSRASSLRKDLARLREKRIQAEASCSQSRQNSAGLLVNPHKKPVNMLSLLSKPAACKLLEEVEAQLDDAEERWDTFETEARRAEVPWQWLE